jgi:hypothetical protein
MYTLPARAKVVVAVAVAVVVPVKARVLKLQPQRLLQQLQPLLPPPKRKSSIYYKLRKTSKRVAFTERLPFSDFILAGS